MLCIQGRTLFSEQLTKRIYTVSSVAKVDSVLKYKKKNQQCKWKGTFFFLAFQGCTCSIFRFPGQGSNWSYSQRPVPQPQQCSTGIELHLEPTLQLMATQCQILNLLSEARNQTSNLMFPSQIRFRCATMGTPKEQIYDHHIDMYSFLLRN